MGDEILNINNKGGYHGYQEWYQYYTLNDVEIKKLTLRNMYKNDLEIGYEEYHHIKETNFYIR